MEDPEVENLALSSSSDVDAEFDAVIGHIEDIIMDEEFQVLQRHFMDKYYLEFENTEENKLSYTQIFQEYVDLLEKYIEKQLIERIPSFNMVTFITSLQQHKDEISGDIFDMLLTFTDFLAFKEMFLDYRMVLLYLEWGYILTNPSQVKKEYSPESVPASFLTELKVIDQRGYKEFTLEELSFIGKHQQCLDDLTLTYYMKVNNNSHTIVPS
ncbi:ADP-ribosylation factor-like protein 2-binding protein isoform X2 [Narcine bancroftii]